MKQTPVPLSRQRSAATRMLSELGQVNSENVASAARRFISFPACCCAHAAGGSNQNERDRPDAQTSAPQKDRFLSRQDPAGPFVDALHWRSGVVTSRSTIT